MKCTLLFFYCFCSFVSHAQIRGRVVDINKESLPGVSVLLYEIPDKVLVATTITDTSGRYSLTPKLSGKYILRFSLVGMESLETQEIEYTDSFLDLGETLLLAQNIALNDVVVRSQQPLFEFQDGGISFIVAKSILATGSSALEVIERMPGIRLDQTNGQIYLNGKGGVLVFMNDRALRMPAAQLFTFLAGLNANEISKIELLNSPPAGFDADGAVIRIITKKHLTNGGDVSATVGHGVKPKAASTLRYSKRLKGLQVSGSYSFLFEKSYSDMTVRSWQNMPVFGGNMEVDLKDTMRYTTQSHQLNLNIDYQLDSLTNLSLTTGSSFSRNLTQTLDRTKYFLEADSVVYLSSELSNSNHWRGLNTSLAFSRQLNEKYKLKADADLWNFRNSFPNTAVSSFKNLGNMSENAALFSNQQRGYAQTQIGILAFKTDLSAVLSKKISYEAGAKFSQTSNNSSSGLESWLNNVWQIRTETQNEAEMKEKIWASYLQVNWVLNSKNKLILGTRFESSNTQIHNVLEDKLAINNHMSRFFPNVQYSIDINSVARLSFSYSERVNRPTYNDLASYVIYSDVTAVYTGNSFLKPTFSKNGSLSFSYKGNQWTLLGSQNKNVIIGGQLTEAPLRNLLYISPQNIKEMNSMGVQANHALRVSSWWSASLYYQVLRQKSVIDYTLQPVVNRYTTFSSTFTNQFSFKGGFSMEVSAWYNSQTYFGTVLFGRMGAVNLGFKKAIRQGTLQFSVSDVLGNIISTSQYGTLTEEAFSIRNKVRVNGESSVIPVFRLSFNRSIGGNKSKDNTPSSEERSRVRI